MDAVRTAPLTAAEGNPLLRYWPEVDGLRTIAVVSVFLFHLERSALPGGFVGVDIFFVISGFLISAILLSDIEQRRFSITRFYRRRIARIAPAFFVVLAATIVASGLIYSAQDYASAASAAAFSAASAANIKYMIMGSYFQISPDAQPLVHYWSLAVEEQFYLLYPFYLFAVARWTRRALVITLGFAVLSFALCVVTTHYNPVYAFYLLPTRGWELLAGGSVMMLRWRGIRPSPALAKPLSLVGFALIALSFVVIRDGPNFPGAIALLPVAGTALLLATVGDPAPLLNRVLGSRLPVYVGKRSYSLYLWHWPIFSMIDYRFYALDWVSRTGFKIGLTLVVTWLCYRLIERPARRYFNAPEHQWITFGSFAAAVALSVVVGVQIRAANYLDADTKRLASGGVHAAVGQRGSIALIGDSEAAMYAGSVAEFARTKGFDFHTLGVPGQDELPGSPRTVWSIVQGYLAGAHPDVVVIVEAWDEKLSAGVANLRDSVDAVNAMGSEVILVTQVAVPPPLGNREGIRAGARGPFAEVAGQTKIRQQGNALVASLAAPHVAVVDAASLLQNPDRSIKLIGTGGVLNYQDSRHLSSVGTALVMPMLGTAIENAIARKRLARPR